MKNKTMRVAALLLALTLMTSCFVGGTFAKYTTAGESLDSARVAKWGVVVTGKTAAENTLFVKEYSNSGMVTVDADVDVVAPGTSGTMADFTISGSPEVAVEVVYDATVTISGWAVTGDDFYCPIKVTVGTTVINGLDCTDAADFAGKIKAAIVATSSSYNVGATIDSTLTVSWEWAFQGSTEGGTGHAEQFNAKDTLLGDSWENHTISINVTCTVNQVD